MRIHRDTLPKGMGANHSDSEGWIHGFVEFNEGDRMAQFVTPAGLVVIFRMTKPQILAMTHEKMRMLVGVVYSQDKLGNDIMSFRELNFFFQ